MQQIVALGLTIGAIFPPIVLIVAVAFFQSL
jgi:hypothetical protein